MQKKNLNRNKSHENFKSLRNRDKTPNLSRTMRKNPLKVEDKKPIRSKTPNMVIRKRRPDPKEKEKEKNNKVRKAITPLKTTKRDHNNIKTAKIPSYMAGTSSNMNKNKKVNNKNDLSVKKAKTPDQKNRNKNTKKKTTSKKNNEDNNIQLIDLKLDDLKIHIQEPVENDQKIEKEKEEEKKCLLEPVIDNNKIIYIISDFLDEQSKYYFFSCNKILIKYLYEKIKISLEGFNKLNNIDSLSTIQDKINAVKMKYKSDEFKEELPPFSLSKGAVKAIELLNDDRYNQIFKTKELNPPLDDIIFIYRLFFKLLKDNSLATINDDQLFWMEASDYILNNNNGKTGEFFKESIKNFDFSAKNIYEIKKIVKDQADKIKPQSYSKICSTTGLIVFLIKDTFEFIGIINNTKKNVPILLLKYLEYIKDIQTKIEEYINYLKKINGNI